MSRTQELERENEKLKKEIAELKRKNEELEKKTLSSYWPPHKIRKRGGS